MWVYADDREDGRPSVAVQGMVEGTECFERDEQEWQEGGSQRRHWQLETSRFLEGMVGSQIVVKTKDTGILVSTIDYVINLAEKHQVLIQKISLSMAELMEDDTADFECHGLLDQIASHGTYILIVGGLGTYLLIQFHGELLVLWLILAILAYICMMELAGWIGFLAGLRGTADCRSKISVTINNLGKFRVIFNSGLEDLFSACDIFSDDWNELPSHPLPTAGTPPHQIVHTHDSAGLPTGYHPPSIATYSGSVKDYHTMRAKDRAGLTADHYV
ncbi:hypothetical protein ARMGADRAFT_1026423 [Armillaria gallica]|uniref:Uncharacterized protein n=1 Tax=Armillaria gallica TaxID=47427 RepID=A0A2H3E3X3_ARMGA|nr:hypothetical protein ARMGADRAFT_1026423 [Armillaria gallica]